MKKILCLMTMVCILTACKETVDDIDAKGVERWEAIINGNYEKAYDYLAPSVKNAETLLSYSMRMETAKLNTTWKTAEFVSKDCDEELCTVVIAVRYVYRFPQKSMGKSEMVIQLTENWINTSGKWYHLPKKG